MRKLFFLILAGIIIIIFLGIFAWQGIYQPKNRNSTEPVIFLVEKGEGSKEIALNLEKEGLVWWGPLFRAYVLIRGTSKSLQAGIYELSPSMNIPEIVDKFVLGNTIKIKVTIPEGFTLKQIEEELTLELKRNIFFNFRVDDFKNNFQFLNDAPAGASLEGFLFPDTYLIEPIISEKEIIEVFLKNFDKKFTPYRPALSEKSGAGAVLTPFEIVTMASLIEKEVKTKEDKEIVSGILWKRIKTGIPLQVDATISYITGESTTKISKEDTQIDSPYNTYKYLGLPKGPICNSGLESILAVLYPKESNYWYYLSTPEGKTIFSRTLEEHNIAKAKYLK